MDVLAVIPARGGSRGIPRKNLQPLDGMPLVAHSIRAARAARHPGRIVVSTDDPEIAAVAGEAGAEVVFRPAALSGDTASSEAALLHVLAVLEEQEGYRPDLLVFLQCTSPLTLPQDIDATVDALLAQEADSALAVVPFHHFLWQEAGPGRAVGINHDPRVRLPRQQQPPQYLETGAVYVMRADGFRRARHRFFGRIALYVMPRERAHEIDEPVDLAIAEAMLRFQRQRRPGDGRLPMPEAVPGLQDPA